MSYIHFKLVTRTDYDKIVFDGVSLTLGQLKKLIFEKAKLTKRFDYDLEIRNADTKEIYKNENDLIQKNTRVHVRRIMKEQLSGSLRPISKPSSPITQSTTSPPSRIPTPPIIVTVQTPINILSVEKPTEAIAEQLKVTPLSVNKPIATVMPEIRMESFKKNVSLPDIVKPNYEQKLPINKQIQRTPSANYLCPCKKPGHFRNQCPELPPGIFSKEDVRPRYPTGIPRSFMIKANANDPNVMLGPEGHVIHKIDHEALKVVKKDRTPFLSDEEEEKLKKTRETNRQQSETLPNELTCSFIEHGKHLIKDAVLLPCCGHFICCFECICDKILKEEIVICPIKECSKEIEFSLETITPHQEMRKMVNDYLNDIKLNKINKLEKTSKTDEAFIDLLLNVDFNISSSDNNNLSSDVSKPLSSLTDENIKKVEVSPENSENELYKDFIETTSTSITQNTTILPIQDNKISSTLSVSSYINDTNTSTIVTTVGFNKNEIIETKKIETLETPAISEINVISSVNRNNLNLESKIHQINETSISSNQQPIPALHTSANASYQFHGKYPYQTSKVYQAPLQNYINYTAAEANGTSISMDTKTTITTSTLSQIHQPSYYPLSSSIYSYRNPPPQHYTPISYTPYGTVPTSYIQKSSQNIPILSERQFYEYQERLRRERELMNDQFVKKRKRSRTRSRSKSTSSRSHHTSDSYHSHKESKKYREYEKSKQHKHRSHSRSRSKSKSKRRSHTPSTTSTKLSSSVSQSPRSSIEHKKKSKSSNEDKNSKKSHSKIKISNRKEDDIKHKEKHKKHKKKHKHKSKSKY